MLKQVFFISISFAIAVVLLVTGFNYILSESEVVLFYSISLKNHFISFVFCFVTFIISGYELKYIYGRNTEIKLTTYEVISLPVSMNLLGFVFPFQGSFLYLIAYMKLKYKTSILNTTYIYAFLFLLSMSISGLLGIVFYLKYSSVSFLFLILSVLLLINPVIIFYIGKLLEKFKPRNLFLLNKPKLILEQIINNLNLLVKDKYVTLTIIGFNLLSTFVYAIWSYWIALHFNINITFFAILIMTFLLKITMLMKFTPGNLGLAQFATGGIVVLLGGKAADGFLISLFQSLTYLLTALSLWIIFTINNFNYFDLTELKSMILSNKQTNLK